MWTYFSDQCMGVVSKSKGVDCFLLKIVAHVEIHLCMQVVFILDCASPQCKRTHEENLWHYFIYSHVIVNGKWKSLILVRWLFFSMKVDYSFNPCMAILILYASPFPLLCGCMNPHQMWTMHLSLVDMVVGSFFVFSFPSQSSMIFLFSNGCMDCGNVSKLYVCGHLKMQPPISFFNGATYLSSYGASFRDILRWWW